MTVDAPPARREVPYLPLVVWAVGLLLVVVVLMGVLARLGAEPATAPDPAEAAAVAAVEAAAPGSDVTVQASVLWEGQCAVVELRAGSGKGATDVLVAAYPSGGGWVTQGMLVGATLDDVLGEHGPCDLVAGGGPLRSGTS